jgi:glycerophosphoryl diester phosphodiesterase
VLAKIPADKKLLIEIKSAVPDMTRTLARVAAAGPVPLDHLIFIDFNAHRLSELLSHLPEAHCLLLSGAPQEEQASRWVEMLEGLIAQAKASGFRGLSLSRSWLWDQPMVDRIRQAGLSVDVWTVNDPAQAAYLARCGVERLTTDCPARIRESLSGDAHA